MSNKLLKGGISNYIYKWNTNSGACDECQSLDNTVYDNPNDIPPKPHPNCKCSVDIVEDSESDDSAEIMYHEKLKQASIYVYTGNSENLPVEYRVIERRENSNNGFYADVLTNGKDIIIVYKGTTFRPLLPDARNDIAMARSRIPAQAADAISLYDKIKRENPDKNITVTGHSLGGSLAEIVGAVRGANAVTFNAYGVRDMFKNGTRLNERNITNYVNELDSIAVINGENHLGSIYVVPNIGAGKIGIHKAEGMGNLFQRVERQREEIIKNRERLHPRTLWGKNKISSIHDTREKIANKLRTEIEELHTKLDKNLREFKHSLRY